MLFPIYVFSFSFLVGGELGQPGWQGTKVSGGNSVTSGQDSTQEQDLPAFIVR
jgi:hypothetical protein